MPPKKRTTKSKKPRKVSTKERALLLKLKEAESKILKLGEKERELTKDISGLRANAKRDAKAGKSTRAPAVSGGTGTGTAQINISGLQLPQASTTPSPFTPDYFKKLISEVLPAKVPEEPKTIAKETRKIGRGRPKKIPMRSSVVHSAPPQPEVMPSTPPTEEVININDSFSGFEENPEIIQDEYEARVEDFVPEPSAPVPPPVVYDIEAMRQPSLAQLHKNVAPSADINANIHRPPKILVMSPLVPGVKERPLEKPSLSEIHKSFERHTDTQTSMYKPKTDLEAKLISDILNPPKKDLPAKQVQTLSSLATREAVKNVQSIAENIAGEFAKSLEEPKLKVKLPERKKKTKKETAIMFEEAILPEATVGGMTGGKVSTVVRAKPRKEKAKKTDGTTPVLKLTPKPVPSLSSLASKEFAKQLQEKKPELMNPEIRRIQQEREMDRKGKSIKESIDMLKKYEGKSTAEIAKDIEQQEQKKGRGRPAGTTKQAMSSRIAELAKIEEAKKKREEEMLFEASSEAIERIEEDTKKKKKSKKQKASSAPAPSASSSSAPAPSASSSSAPAKKGRGRPTKAQQDANRKALVAKIKADLSKKQ
jgi:hypothetical protein